MLETAVLITMGMITLVIAFITVKISEKIPILQFMFLFLTFVFIIVDMALIMEMVGETSDMYGIFTSLYKGMLYITMFLAFYTFVFLLQDWLRKGFGKSVR